MKYKILLDTLFIYGEDSNIYVDGLNVENGKFVYGAIQYSDIEPYKNGNIEIKNSLFKDIHSLNGPAVYIDSISKPYGYNQIILDGVTFENTTAYDRGGVIYSVNSYANEFVSFHDCKFQNINAKFGMNF